MFYYEGVGAKCLECNLWVFKIRKPWIQGFIEKTNQVYNRKKEKKIEED